MKKLLSLLLCLLLCLGSASALAYDGYVSQADVLIDIPNLRQYGGYTCGTTCVQMLMNWLCPYEADLNLAAYEEMLGTTDEGGTSGEAILRFFAENGVAAEAGEGRTAEELVQALDKGHPMLICLQAWSTAEDGSYNTDNSADADTYLVEGHWVICVGYRQDAEGITFYFNDPACTGYCLLSAGELEARWIDMGADGKIYRRYGVEISGETDYRSDGAYHLD